MSLRAEVTLPHESTHAPHILYVRDVLELNLPPDIRTLMQDPIYAKFVRTRPKLPATLTHPSLSPPWVVWVWMSNEKWRTKEFATYDEAYLLMKRQLELPNVTDLAIVCKRRMVGPPAGYRWPSRKYPWCARCRRPSMFLNRLHHRALRGAEVTLVDTERCFYCGIRQIALPKHSPR